MKEVKTYRVFLSRLTYDEFSVAATSKEEAAYMVANGKVREERVDVPADHDYFQDEPEEVYVVSDLGDNNSAGYSRILLKRDTHDVLSDDFKIS